MPDIFPALAKIANEAQNNSSTHPRCILQMRKIFDSNPFGEFWGAFRRILSIVLRCDYKQNSNCVNRAISYVATFCTSMEKRNIEEDESIVESELLTNTFKYLMKMQHNKSDNVRFHSCLLINKILDNLIGAELSVNVWDNIQDAMLERAQDSRVGVRIQALTALYSLQDPTNPDCPVINEYVARIKNDANPSVRKLCVEKVALRRNVISVVLQHSLDINEKVRLAVYNRAVKFPQHFKIIQRQMLIRNGIYGGSEAVVDYINKQLIPTWLHHWNDNYLELAKALRLDSNLKDLEDSTEIIEYVLKSLITTNPRSETLSVLELDEKKLVQSALELETVIYWRVLWQVLKELDEYDAAELMPEFIHFCKYIKSYNESKKNAELDELEYLEYQFILSQMFNMVAIYDLSDPSCRQCLNELISEIIQNTTLQPEVVQTMIDCLNYTFPRVDDKIRFVAELLSEIIYHTPEVNKVDVLDNFELAQKKVKLYNLQQDQEEAIKERDFLRADRLNKEIEETKGIINESREEFERAANEEVKKRTDEPTLKKYLDVCIALLSCPKIKVLCNVLRALKDDSIQNLLMHESLVIRQAALKCFGLLCILDEQSAKVGIHLFCATIEAYKSGKIQEVPNVLTAISAVVDLILLFGSDLIANPHTADNNSNDGSFDEQQEAVFSGGSSLTTIIQILVDFMHDENIEVQEKSGIGLCQLLLAGRIQSPSVLSRLIIKWASPATDEDDESILTQLIGLMLERLPKCPDASSQIERCIIPTVKTIFKAPKSSPLADINLNNLIKFFYALCSSCPNPETVHMNLATSLCNEILDHPLKAYNIWFSRILIMLSFSGCEKSSIMELLAICEEIREDISDRQVLNNINKFIAMLSKYLRTSLVAVDEESDDSKENKSL